MSTTKATARLLVTVLVGAMLAAAPPKIAAESVCDLEDTPEACWAKVQAHPIASEARKAVAASETGVDTAGSNLATVARDFLNAFDVAGLFGAGTTDDAEEGTAVLDLNFVLPGQIRERNGQLQVVLETEPSLYEPLKMAIEDGGGEDAADLISELESDLGEVGDATATFSLNWRGRKLGRYFSVHRPVYQALFVAATEGEPAIQFVKLLQQLQAAASACVPDATCNCIDVETCSFLRLAGKDPALAHDLRSGLVAAAAEDADLEKNQRRAMTAGRLADFARLVDNQPQLHASAKGVFRDRLVGPDELSVEVTYEWPLAPNLNRFWRRAAGLVSREELAQGGLDDAKRTALLKSYRSYVAEREDDLETPDRFSLSFQYIDRDRLNITLPGEDGARHEFSGSESVVVKVGWGRPIELKPDGTVRTRADVVGSWEDVSDDPARHDRGLVAVTVTRDFGGFSIPFGIVYSNKPEFLADLDVDEQISAHVGFKYSVDGLGTGH